MPTRTRPVKGNTTQRGYGYAHMQRRQAALATLVEGTLCHHCHRPMFRTQKLDLDHTPDRKGWRGLAHASCNRRDGAIRGNKLRAHTTHRHSRTW